MEQEFTIEITESYKKSLFKELINSFPKLDDDYEYRLSEIERAYNLAFDAHKMQRRKGGDKEPYISHPVAVAKIIALEMGLGTTSVVSALLHDVVEDTPISIEEIEEQFGNKVAIIVGGVTKITKDSGKTKSYQLETFKKMILAAPKDHRVILIKIADRLHNMRTMEDMPDNSRQIKSSENLFIYAPIANIVGMRVIKNEIEDLSFRYLDNKEYLNLKEMAVKYGKRKKFLFKSLTAKLKSFFVPNFLHLEFETIEKSLYSSWIKIKERNTELLCSVHNFHSIRISIGAKKNDKKNIRQIAYNLFQEITEHYDLKINTLQDWIKDPKKNGFSALIFDILDEKGNQFEIQILSKENKRIADRGFLPLCKKLPDGFKFIETDILEELDANETTNETIERLKLSINPTKIFIFTPQGKKIELPKKATVLDFAFKVHTEIGLHCVGAKINDKKTLYPCSKTLNSTDKVEILTHKNKYPKSEWLNIATTNNAKKSIINFLNKKNETKEHSKTDKTTTFPYKKKLIVDGTFDYIASGCCNPLPGEDCIAYQNEINKIFIHKKNCKETEFLRASQGNKTVDIVWIPMKRNATITSVFLEGYDKVGIIEDVVRTISNDMEINMKEFWIKAEEDIFKGQIDLYVFDLKHRDNLIKNLKKINGIITVNSK